MLRVYAALLKVYRYKESLLRITRQTDEVETLFYAIGLLMRALRPLRVRQCELVAQKRFLKNQLNDTIRLRDGLAVLSQALTGQLEDHPLSYPSLRPFLQMLTRTKTNSS